MTGTVEWSDDQWGRVRQTVHDEALRARVAASFLPLYGPLPGDVQAVPVNTLELAQAETGPDQRLAVNDFETRRLTTLSVNVFVKNAQMADPELTSALIMFRRAAAIVARLEDEIIFNGQSGTGEGPAGSAGSGTLPPVYKISGGGKYAGLLEIGSGQTVSGGKTVSGPAVFSAVVEAIQLLEYQGYLGPYACVMGNELFKAITTPMEKSMVLPRDSILPFLDGPLMRTGALPPKAAVVVSLQGAPAEIVVPSDIAVKYLQTSADGEHIFRVQQKFVLRVKEAQAIATVSF